MTPRTLNCGNNFQYVHIYPKQLLLIPFYIRCNSVSIYQLNTLKIKTRLEKFWPPFSCRVTVISGHFYKRNILDMKYSIPITVSWLTKPLYCKYILFSASVVLIFKLTGTVLLVRLRKLDSLTRTYMWPPASAIWGLLCASWQCTLDQLSTVNVSSKGTVLIKSTHKVRYAIFRVVVLSLIQICTVTGFANRR